MYKPYQVITLERIDSTSRYLKELVAEQIPTTPIFCTTQIQTHGYGQQKRSWITHQDSTVFSLAYPLTADVKISGLLSLHIASLLHQSLSELTPVPLYLKWPNDIFNQDGKVAGLLIEQVIKKGYRALVIGIGINRTAAEEIENSGGVGHFDVHDLFESFFIKINQTALQNYSPMELNHYWQAHDLFKINETVRLISPKTEETGIYLGINPQGQAMIEASSVIRTLSSGQTSIRK